MTDTAEIRARHPKVPEDPNRDDKYGSSRDGRLPDICGECMVPYPCDAIRLSNKVDRQAAEIEQLKAEIKRLAFNHGKVD